MASDKSKDMTAAGPQDPTASWITLQDHRPLWLADEMVQHCICDAAHRADAAVGKRAHTVGCPSQVQGILLGTMEMNPSEKNVKDNKPIEDQFWIAVVVQLTAKTKARSAEKDIREFEAGTQIMVGGYDLNSLHGRADHPTQ